MKTTVLGRFTLYPVGNSSLPAPFQIIELNDGLKIVLKAKSATFRAFAGPNPSEGLIIFYEILAFTKDTLTHLIAAELVHRVAEAITKRFPGRKAIEGCFENQEYPPKALECADQETTRVVLEQLLLPLEKRR